MEATGAEQPIIYILGEAPGEVEDREGRQFVGPSGAFLRPLIPKEWRDKIRWNNVINCHPAGNANPTDLQIECCRSRIVQDIENSKPKVIWAFGNVPLKWLLNQTGISIWRGRYIPIKVGSHPVWVFPFLHPSFIIRNGQRSESEESRVTKFDIENAFNRLNRLREPKTHTAAEARANTLLYYGEHARDLGCVLQFLDIAGKHELTGVDYETYPLRPYANGEILSIAISTERETISFGLHHPGAKWLPQQLKQIKEAWTTFLKIPCRKAVHNTSFEYEWTAYLWGWDIIRASHWEDTISQAFVLNEQVGALSLEFLVQQYFGINIKELAGLNRKDLRQEPIEDVLRYNAIDAKYHRLLFIEQQKRLEEEGLVPQYEDMLRRVASCVLTQLKGVPADLSVTEELHNLYSKQITEAEQEIANYPEARQFRRIIDKPFNPGSPTQVKQLCTQVLKIDARADKYGKEHADEELLKEIELPIAKSIIRYKKTVKLKSTYVDSVKENIFPDGLIHPNYNTVFVKTSRSSCDSPNCFPPEVEVLSMTGWVTWGLVTENTLLAQFDTNLYNITFDKPTDVIKHKFSGNLCRIHTDYHIDILCTPDHDLLVQTKGKVGRKGNFRKYEAALLPIGDQKLFHAGHYISGTISLNPAQLILIAALQADGYLDTKNGYIEWRFSRSRKIHRLEMALLDEKIPFNKGIHNKNRDGAKQTRFYIARRDVPDWLKDKKQFGPWILNLSAPSLYQLSSELQNWDGSFTRKDEVCVGNQKDADWIQILYILTNQRASIRKRESTSDNTTFVCNGAKPYSYTSNRTITLIPYEGLVYCATMPKGTVIVRHNGKAAITYNCQNYPKRTDEGRVVRKQIKAPPGYVIAAVDYARIQAYNVGMESKDPTLCKMLWEEYDIHGEWARKLAYAYPKLVGGKKGINDAAVMKKFRDNCKSWWTFALLFGAQLETLCAPHHLNAPTEVIQPLYDEWWETFSGVLDWQEGLRKKYAEVGYVENLTGIRRRAPIRPNQLINAPIQADEAAIVFDAFNRLSEIGDPNLQPIMEIHDDLTFLLPENEWQNYAETIIDEMVRCTFPWINVPLGAELSIGPSWYDMKHEGTFWSHTWHNEPVRPEYAY